MRTINILFLSAFLALSQLASGQNSEAFFKVFPKLNGTEPGWVQQMYSANANVFEVADAYAAFYQKHAFSKNLHTQNYKHWLLQVGPYITSTGEIRVPNAQQQLAEHQELRSRRDANNAARSGGSNWTNIGPMRTYNNNGNLEQRPTQTNILCMGIAPSNADTMYAGAEGGGVWLSTDHGMSWQAVSFQAAFTNTQDIKVHPTNPAIVYVASGPDIYKTTNSGSTWTLNQSCGGTVEQFYIHRTQPSKVWAATRAGLFYTSDDAATWTNTWAIHCWDIEPHAISPDTIYLSVHDAGDVRAEVYKSVDTGANWTLMANGWYVPTDVGNASDIGCKLAVTPADPDRVYACLIGNSKAGDNGWIGVYYSLDGAATWINSDGIDGGPYVSGSTAGTNWFFAGYSSGYHQGWYNFDLDASHVDPDRIWIGTIWDMESSDRGASIEYFRSTRGLSMHADVQDIDVNGSEVWITSDGGINFSSDEMQTTESRQAGITASIMWGFGHGWNEDTWTGGRYHNGDAVHHENFGIGNTMFMGGAESATGYVNQFDNRKTYYSDIGDKSTPDALSQPSTNIANLGMYPNQSYGMHQSSELHHDPRYAKHMYLGRDSVLWKSIDGGATFSSLYSFGTGTTVLEFEISRANPDVIYVVVRTGSCTIYKSTDGGTSFAAVTAVPSNSTSRIDISLKPSDPDYLWATSYYGNNSSKVYLSDDGGNSWQNKTTSATNGHRIADILCQAGTANLVYIVTDYGAFVWNEGTQAWDDMSAGLPFRTGARRLKPFYRDGKLRMAGDRGVWEVPFCAPSTPAAQPMTESSTRYCARDTVDFECFSVLNHAGASWHWSFSPTPTWVSDSLSRSPRAIFSASGSYDVTLMVTDGSGTSDTNLVIGMITVDNQCAPDSVAGMALGTSNDYDYVNVPDINLLQTNTITMSAWVKPKGAQPAYSGILFNDGTSAGLNFRAGNMLAYHWPGGAWWWNSGLEVDSNQWSHVAMVVTPDSITLYLNGVGSTHHVSPGLVDFHSMKVASYKGWGSRNYKGEIDEVRFWNRALSRDELRAQRHLTMEAGSSDLTDLVLYYQFNEQPGTEVLDRVGGLHGTLNNQAKRTGSTAPIGAGSCAGQQIAAPGLYNFADAGAQLQWPGPVVPNGDVWVTRIRSNPDSLPNTHDQVGCYWIVNNYGTNTTFNALARFNLYPVTGWLSSLVTSNPWWAELHRRDNDNEHQSNWSQLCTASAATDGPEGYFAFAGSCNITGFSQFTISSNAAGNSLLPIEGVTFSAARHPEGMAELTWKAENEANIEHYVVERAIGNGAFSPLKEVVARDPGGSAVQTYVLFDAKPAHGTNYYRLRSTNADGEHAWSEVRALQFGTEQAQLRVYPNPTNGVLNIALTEQESTARVRLYDSRSKLAKDCFIGHENGAIDLSGLQQGVYHYSMQTSEHLYHGQIVVQ